MGSVSFSLEGQVAVITGASRNIGAAIALAFAEAGADLFVVARTTPPLEDTAQRIRDTTGRRVVTFGADVAHPEAAEAIFDAAMDAYSAVDTLVNNAHFNGGTYGTSFFDLPDDGPFIATLQTNLLGPVRLSRLFGKRMLDGDGGNIINVVSGSGFQPTPGSSAYGCSKAALWFLTRCLAAEGAPKVRANAVCPGGVTESGVPRNEAQAFHLPMVPMGRLGRPHEIAGAAVYLASPAAAYTTGAVIVANGGRPW